MTDRNPTEGVATPWAQDRIDTASGVTPLTAAAARKLPLAGETFAGFRIEREIGRGAMGAVLLARRGSEPPVALKVMAEVGSEELRRRFAREGKALSRMRHPNVVAVRDTGDDGGVLWIAMEYVEGVSLARHARGGLPFARVIEVAEAIAHALEHVHGHGLVHRDLKPENVLVTRTGEVKVVDFGLVKDLATVSPLTRSGDVLGTPHYLAPETVRGDPALVTTAADIYALGVILYELATGSLPFDGHTGAGIKVMLRAIREAEVEPPSKRAPGLPLAFDALVLRALDRRVEKRYPTAAALARDLERLRRGEALGGLVPLSSSSGTAPALATERVGEFEVLEEIGRGGSGVVHRGRGPDGRFVAIKFLLDPGEAHASRFERERRILALLGESEGFVPFLASGTSVRGPYVVLRFMGGGTLRDRLARGLEPGEALPIVRAMVAAMARAHERGIVHRDLKPENILFSLDGRPLVTDLGLAKEVAPGAPGSPGSLGLSQTGEFRGTPGYMPLEQMEDARRAAPAADVFALGVIAYECLAGVRAFDGPTLEVITKVSKGLFVPLDQRAPGTPRWLVRAVERALSVDPRARFRDAAAFLEALETGEGASPGRARPAAIAGGVVLVGAALALVAVGSGRAPDSDTRPTRHVVPEKPGVAPVANLARLLRGEGTESDVAGLATLPPQDLAELARQAIFLPPDGVRRALEATRSRDLVILEAVAAVASAASPREQEEAARRLRALRPSGLALNLANATLAVARFVENLEQARGRATEHLRGDSLAHVFEAMSGRPDLVGVAVAALAPAARRDLVSSYSRTETQLLAPTIQETPAFAANLERLPPELVIACVRAIHVTPDARERLERALLAASRALEERDPLVAAIGYDSLPAQARTTEDGASRAETLLERVLASTTPGSDEAAALALGRAVAHALAIRGLAAAAEATQPSAATGLLETAEAKAEVALERGLRGHLGDDVAESDSHVLVAIRLALGSTQPEPEGLRLSPADPLALLERTPLPSASEVEKETSRFLADKAQEHGTSLVTAAYALRARARTLLGDAAGAREDETHLSRKRASGGQPILTPTGYAVRRAAERLLLR